MDLDTISYRRLKNRGHLAGIERIRQSLTTTEINTTTKFVDVANYNAFISSYLRNISKKFGSIQQKYRIKSRFELMFSIVFEVIK